MIPRNAKLHGPYLLSSRLYCRLRSFTESAISHKGNARGLYRRWGLSPRPEDIHLKWPVDSIIEFSLIHDSAICNCFFHFRCKSKKRASKTGKPTRVIIPPASLLFPLVFFTRVFVEIKSSCQWISGGCSAKIQLQGEQNSLKQNHCFKQS